MSEHDERSGGFYVQRRQLLAAEAALKEFRAQKEAEKSEFAAEFQRLSLEHARNNAATLLECTADELKALILQRRPDMDEQRLNVMHKEELVDYLRQISLE